MHLIVHILSVPISANPWSISCLFSAVRPVGCRRIDTRETVGQIPGGVMRRAQRPGTTPRRTRHRPSRVSRCETAVTANIPPTAGPLTPRRAELNLGHDAEMVVTVVPVSQPSRTNLIVKTWLRQKCYLCNLHAG